MRVLVVEDQAENLALMTYLLEAFGHETMVARDGRSGITAARQQRPDAVVMDLEMPGMSGLEAATIMKADPPLAAIPLIAVTASAMPDDRDRVLAAGFDGYIVKPIEPRTFVTQIERLCAEPGGR